MAEAVLKRSVGEVWWLCCLVFGLNCSGFAGGGSLFLFILVEFPRVGEGNLLR